MLNFRILKMLFILLNGLMTSCLTWHVGKSQPVMDWKSRIRIAVGSAKGLAYLHEDCHPKIIHRDIKAVNILLDNNFEAMVADFGLAKFTSDDITHVSTRVMGTFGYMAPEYASTGKLTDKSDVFSFGVMLLELITRRRPIDHTNNVMEDSLVDWARPLMPKALESGNFDELVDPRLEVAIYSASFAVEALGVYEVKRGNFSAKFTNWGATLISLLVPDRYGNLADVALGYQSVYEYTATTSG